MNPPGPEKEHRPLIFLGGIFTPGQTEMIQNDSIGVVQNAADSLQKHIIRGLTLTYPGQISVVNLPYIGAYPVGFKRAFFPGTDETVFSTVKVTGQRFCSVRFIKPFARALSALRGLMRSGSRNPTILIYSAHLPFLWAAIIYRLVFRQTRICLILPDFPEFMGVGGFFYNIAKFVESKIFYFLARFIDGFVVLTKHMATRMSLADDKFVVVEGIADVVETNEIRSPASINRIFFYSGTLAGRYGILHLLESFSNVQNQNVELWICGEGDSKASVIDAAAQDNRIKFLGQITRDAVISLQKQADVLVNPRLPSDEFVMYSFPSKTLEYMSSGRPVLMYELAGIPEEYRPYYTSPTGPDAAALTEAIEGLSRMSADDLSSMGALAADFVRQHKSAVPQCRKIVTLLYGIQP